MHGIRTMVERLSQKRVVVVSRFRTGVPVMNLTEFLRGKVQELILIRHPFFFNPDSGSSLIRWEHNALIDEKRTVYKKNISEAVLYVQSFIQTWRWIWRYPNLDLFIGIGILDAFAGVFLRKVGKIRTVIFYSIDFVPKRFQNPLFNLIFRLLEWYVVTNADFVWNLSPVMVEMREKLRGVSPRHRAKQFVVPIGTDPEARQCSLQEIHRLEICYVGHLREGQGVDFLLKIFSRILAHVPKASLLLVGGGEKEQMVRDLAQQLGIASHIRFTGFLEKEEDVQDLIAHAAIAVAPYEDTPDNFTRFTDPGKIKTYLAAGVPVIMTDIVPIARTLQEQRCGIAVPFVEDMFVEKIVTLLTDDALFEEYKKNAMNLSKEFHWDRIFASAFEHMNLNI